MEKVALFLPGCDQSTILEGNAQIIGVSDLAKVAAADAYFEEPVIDNEEANIKALDIILENTPFHVIAANMTNVDKHGLVKKETIKEGTGKLIQPDATVLVHYQMYFEGKTEPFDSTILRKRQARFKLGSGDILEGFEMALLSMRAWEVSRFLINWKCAFGEVGCPPRIGPKANVLAEIEIRKIIDLDVPELGELSKSGISSKNTIENCEKQLQIGKELFYARKFDLSIRKMNDALQILNHLRINNDEEQSERDKLKLRLHVNLSGIYNHCNRPEQACINCHEALRIDPNHSKALFNFGRANIRLNQFDKAEEVLKKGRGLDPNNQDFAKELTRLEAKRADRLTRIANLKKIGLQEK